MSRLTWDGTADAVSRDQILRREADSEKIIFPVQLTTSRIGNLTRLIHTFATCVTIRYVVCWTGKYQRRSSMGKKKSNTCRKEITPENIFKLRDK